MSISYESTRTWSHSRKKKVLRIAKRQQLNKRYHLWAKTSSSCWTCSFYGHSCAPLVTPCKFFVNPGAAPVLVSKAVFQITVKWSKHFSHLVYKLLIPKLMFSQKQTYECDTFGEFKIDLQMNSRSILTWRHVGAEVASSTIYILAWIATLLLFVFLDYNSFYFLQLVWDF